MLITKEVELFGWRSWAGQLVVLNLAIFLFCGVGHAQAKPPHFSGFISRFAEQSINRRTAALIALERSIR